MRRSTLALATFALAAPLHAGDTFYPLDGPFSPSLFGFSLAVGDLDADGIDDLVVGAPSPGQPHGLTQTFSGRTGAPLHQLSFAPQSGRSVASGGDLDGDGHDDYVTSGDGFARVRSGATGGGLWAVANGGLDDQVLVVGDVDLDTFDDVIVSSPDEAVGGATKTGVIRFYSGKTGALIKTIWGGGLNQEFGWRLANAGDVNHDGRADFLATSRVHLGAKPAVEVVAGVVNDVVATIPALSNSSSEFGAALSGGFDVNGDGRDDIVIGDPGYAISGFVDNGRVHVYSGIDLQPLLTISGPANSRFGAAVAWVDDVNGDGKPDIAIGAPGVTTVVNGAQVKGRVTIVSGTNGATLRTWYAKDATSSGFGTALAGMKANLDGYGDLAIGDRTATTVNSTSGQVIVKSGSFDIGSWSNWGVGFPGAVGAPALTAGGPMAICQENTLALSNSSGGANALPGLVFIGNSMIDLPTGYGGHLLVVPQIVVPVVIPAAGLEIPFQVCDTLLLHAQFRLQAVEFDPAAAKGVSFSPGLLMTFGL